MDLKTLKFSRTIVITLVFGAILGVVGYFGGNWGGYYLESKNNPQNIQFGSDIGQPQYLKKFGNLVIPMNSTWDFSWGSGATSSSDFWIDSGSGHVAIPYLVSCTGDIETDANGVLACGTDVTGGGSGMVTHGLLSNEWHSDVSNASASAGALIYGLGTTWTPLAVGASNSFVVSNGTNPIYLIDPTVASMSITNLWTSTLTGTLTGDLTCTDCLNATEIEDIYFLTAGDNASASVMTIDSADITSASFGTIYAGTWNGAKIDTSDYTNFTAGTGFDLDGDTLNADFSEFTLDTSLLGGDMIPFWEDTGGDEKKISWTNMQASIDALGTITIVGASVSGEFDIVGDLNVPSASFTNIWATGTITGNLTGAVTGNASTATALAANGANCPANQYPLGVDASGAVESCTADAGTTYTATNPLSLVGTVFSIDVASAGGAGAISVANWETFNEKISSLSIDTSAELITIIGDETGSGHIVFDTSPELTTSFTTTGVFAINPGGTLTIGDGGDTLVINSSDWDIDATGIMTGIGALTMDGLFSGTGASLSGDLDISGDLNVASASFTGDIQVLDILVTGGNINTGNIALVIGDATTDTIQFLTDGTGNGEYTFSADGIGDADIDWGSGAGQVDLADFTGGISGAVVWDFGGATSVEGVNSAALTVDANGEFGIDTTAGQFQYYSDEINVLMASTSQGFGIKISSTAFDLTTGGDTFVGEPGTIIGYGCSVTGGTNRGVEIIICDGTTCGDGGSVGASITAVATGITFQDAVTSGTFAAWDEIKASTSDGDMTGTVNWIKCRVFIKPSVQ